MGDSASVGDMGERRDGSWTNGRTRVRKPLGASQGRHQKKLNSGEHPGEEGWGPTGYPLRKTSQRPFWKKKSKLSFESFPFFAWGKEAVKIAGWYEPYLGNFQRLPVI